MIIKSDVEKPQVVTGTCVISKSIPVLAGILSARYLCTGDSYVQVFPWINPQVPVQVLILVLSQIQWSQIKASTSTLLSAVGSCPLPNSYHTLQDVTTASTQATFPIPERCKQGVTYAQKTTTCNCAETHERPPPLISSHPSNVLGAKGPMPPQTVDAQFTGRPPTPTGTGLQTWASTSQSSFSFQFSP